MPPTRTSLSFAVRRPGPLEAEQPVPRTAFHALAHATLRAAVGRVLDELGRVLLETPQGLLSGYADDVRGALADDDLGVLSAEDRAVLCLVMLHAVGLAQAQLPGASELTAASRTTWSAPGSSSPSRPST